MFTRIKLDVYEIQDFTQILAGSASVRWYLIVKVQKNLYGQRLNLGSVWLLETQN